MNRSEVFMAVLIGGLLYVVGQYVASAPQRTEQEIEANREITVSGFGEVQARPDVARLTLGMTTTVQSSAEAAMRSLATQFESIMTAINTFDIAEEDVKTTDLSVRPVYDFTAGRQSIRGYEASESVVVTIRDLDTIGDVLARTTIEGVNQAGGIAFEIDDPVDLQRQAQELAIKNARENAEQLAQALEVKIGKVKSFSVEPKGDLPPVFARAELSAAAEDVIAGPPVPSGSQDISATVQVTFEIK